jgi:competence protein ComEC
MSSRPLLAAALAFVAGTGIGAWLPAEPSAWGWAAALALAAWAVAHLVALPRAGRALGVAVFLLVGIFRCQVDLEPLAAEAEGVAEGEAVFAGRVSRAPERRGADQVLVLEDVRARFAAGTVRFREPLQLILEAGPGDLRIGDRLTARGRIGAIRGDRNLGWFPAPVVPRGRRFAARAVVRSPVWVRLDGHVEQGGPAAAVLRWRAAAAAFWRARPGAPAALQNALTTGERAEIPPAVERAFFRSGLTHLIAISGMNMGFLALVVYFVLRRLLASWEALALLQPVQPLAAALTVPFLWLFYRFSGSQIPAGRAALMTAVAMAAVLLARRSDAADLAGLAAAAILAADPRALFSASFQLSFVALAGLLLVAPRLAAAEGEEGSRQRVLRHLRSLLLVSLAASAVTAPLVAFHFQQVSLVGPVANLVAVPYTGFLALPAGWIALIGAALWHPAGELLRAVALGLAAGLVWIAEIFASPPWSFLRTARPPPALTAALVLLACSLLPPGTRAVRRVRAGALACALAAAGWWAALDRGELRVAFLDVGQGFSAAALLPGGDAIVVDAGPSWRESDAGARIVAPALRKLGARSIDALAITHPHPDHSGGAASLLEEFPVAELWSGPGAASLLPKGVDAALAELRRRGGRVRSFTRGDEEPLAGGVRAAFLNPAAPPDGNPVRSPDPNDDSLVLLLSLGKSGVLVTGDAGPRVARELGALPIERPATLALQVPHHGGSAAACLALADAFHPAVAFVPVGRNSYGHPRAEAVAAFPPPTRLFRSDRDGAVFLRTDGERTEVWTWAELARSRTWPERLRWLGAGW